MHHNHINCKLNHQTVQLEFILSPFNDLERFVGTGISGQRRMIIV